jgi:hypothetical protein
MWSLITAFFAELIARLIRDWRRDEEAKRAAADEASKDILDDIKARADRAADAERGVTADNELPDDPARRRD